MFGVQASPAIASGKFNPVAMPIWAVPSGRSSSARHLNHGSLIMGIICINRRLENHYCYKMEQKYLNLAKLIANKYYINTKKQIINRAKKLNNYAN